MAAADASELRRFYDKILSSRVLTATNGVSLPDISSTNALKAYVPLDRFDLRSELTACYCAKARAVLTLLSSADTFVSAPKFSSLLRCSSGWSPHSLKVHRLTPLWQCFRLLRTY
jgi:hypothetical protein